MWRSRRGAAMIEAAVVLPLLILSVLTCLLISMFFYDTTQKQCRMHQTLRAQAGELTGRIHTLDPAPADEISLSTGMQGLFQTVTGKEETAMIDSIMLKTRVSESTEALWHASDGVSFIRYHTLSRKMKDAR
ncbi:MAG: hypothetical protein IJ109_08075 [Firmicutes bacterium]|nr:hypothetical protein [Bacillota bacterium]